MNDQEVIIRDKGLKRTLLLCASIIISGITIGGLVAGAILKTNRYEVFDLQTSVMLDKVDDKIFIVSNKQDILQIVGRAEFASTEFDLVEIDNQPSQ